MIDCGQDNRESQEVAHEGRNVRRICRFGGEAEKKKRLEHVEVGSLSSLRAIFLN